MTTRGQNAVMLASDVLWTPANLAVPPKVWVDDDSAITDISGSASAWSNSRGSIGGAFVQDTSGNRPQILTAELNGRTVLRFDGTNDFMRITSTGARDLFRNTGSGWNFIVLKKRNTDSPGQSRIVLYSGIPSGPTRLVCSVGQTGGEANRNRLSARRLDANSTVTLSGTATPGNWVIRADMMNWSTGAAAIYLDGALDVSNASLTTAGTTSDTGALDSHLTMGSNSATPAADFGDFDIACALIGSGALPSTDERQKLEGWAAWRYGLEGGLPSGHPYETEPPRA